MPRYVIDRLIDALRDQRHGVTGAKVLVVGASYKPGLGDTRRSPALLVIEGLRREGLNVEYHDPHVPELDLASGRLRSVPWDLNCLAGFDAAVICTDHDAIDYSLLEAAQIVVVDSRNAMERRGLGEGGTVVKA